LPDRVVLPTDSAYLPVVIQEYKPKSTPFEKPVKPVSKLPRNVKESDIKRVITIKGKETVQIIETINGEIHVPRQGDSTEVRLTNYSSPILQFGIFAAAGFNLGSAAASPSVSISLLKIEGKIFAPVFAADLKSVGMGIGYQFYYDLTVTPLLMWNYLDAQRTIKINVSFQL
jgi:hypothetical protein